jgi:hypothetical protein
MAREPVAVDFFGLGNSLVENDSGRRQGEADSSIPPVKPIASIPEKQVVEMSRAVTPLSESERAIGRENSISILRQDSSSSQAERARPPAGGRGEEMQGGIMAKSSVKIGLGKPLEELMDSDIMELSREDCRQYLQERGNDAFLFCVMYSSLWKHRLMGVFGTTQACRSSHGITNNLFSNSCHTGITLILEAKMRLQERGSQKMVLTIFPLLPCLNGSKPTSQAPPTLRLYQKMGACRGDFKMLWKPT